MPDETAAISVRFDGEIHRFGKKDVCWHVAFRDGAFEAGAFGSWKEGGKNTWNNRGGIRLSQEDQDTFQRRMAHAEFGRDVDERNLEFW